MSSRLFLRCLPFALIAIVAACTEQLDTSANCPALCDDRSLIVRDTFFDIVDSDTVLTGFTGVGERWPAPGLPTADANGFTNETYIAVTNRPDSVDIRQVLRFDTLPRTLSAADTTTITALTASKLLLVIDMTRSSIPAGNSTLTLYDVEDSTVSGDTLPLPIQNRFTPQRVIAERTFTRDELLADTIVGSGAAASIRALSITIPDSTMLRFVKVRKRMRIGMRITSPTSTALRLVAPSVRAAGLVPRLTYDPSPDTAILAWGVPTQYIGITESPERFRAQTLVVRDPSPVLSDGSLQAGGMVGVRSLLRVRIPRAFLERVSIVRASMDLTQRPQRTVPGASDAVRLRLRVGIAGPALGNDARRLVEFLDPTLEGVVLPAVRVPPGDSGVKAFDVGDAIRLWASQDSTIPTSFILYSEGETFQEQRPAFFSRRSPVAAVRPRLRLTYTPRREGALP